MKTKPKEINILRVLTENKNRFVQPDKLVLDYNSTWQKKQTNDKMLATEIGKLKNQGLTIEYSIKLGYKLVDVEIKKLF